MNWYGLESKIAAVEIVKAVTVQQQQLQSIYCFGYCEYEFKAHLQNDILVDFRS